MRLPAIGGLVLRRPPKSSAQAGATAQQTVKQQHGSSGHESLTGTLTGNTRGEHHHPPLGWNFDVMWASVTTGRAVPVRPPGAGTNERTSLTPSSATFRSQRPMRLPRKTRYRLPRGSVKVSETSRGEGLSARRKCQMNRQTRGCIRQKGLATADLLLALVYPPRSGLTVPLTDFLTLQPFSFAYGE